MKTVIMYTDGSCLFNPGYGGWCAVLCNSKKKKFRKISGKSLEVTTNNRMELMAVIQGLEYLKEPSYVIIYLDSDYVFKIINEKRTTEWKNKNWKTKRNKPIVNVDLWERLDKQLKRHSISPRLVKSHSGIRFNEICDKEARARAKEVKLMYAR
jgi:ribonuclease HI